MNSGNPMELHSRTHSFGPHSMTDNTQLISSNVVSENFSSDSTPHETVRVIEIPVYKENVVPIPKKQIHEIETIVPVYDYQYKEKLVEVPQIELVNREVEVETIHEVTKRVPVKKIMEVTKEVMKYVPKVITKIVEREVEVPGNVIQVPKPYKVENKVIVPRYINEEMPMVVNQIIEPFVYESQDDCAQVVLKEFQPYLVPVNVYVPRAVEREFIPVKQSHRHRTIDVSPSQYNALVKAANIGATDQDVDGLLVKQVDGSIPMLHTPDLRVIQPTSDDWKQGRSPGHLHVETSRRHSYVYPSFTGT